MAIFWAGVAVLVVARSGLAQDNPSPPQPSNLQSAPTPITSEATAPTRLSQEEALQRARQSSPFLAASGARLAGAQARVRAASAPPNPTLSLAQPYGSELTGGFDEGVYLAQTIELFGKRKSRVAAARAERDATQLEGTGTGAELDFQVRSAYIEALRADAERDLARDSLQTARDFAAAAQTQLQEGEAPRRDLVRAQVEAERAAAVLVGIEAERANRYATLKSLVGLPDDAPVQLSDSLTYTPATFDSSTLQDAIAGRTDVQSAGLRVQARQAEVRAARAASRPDAFIEGRRAKLSPSNPGTSVRIGVTLSPFDFGRNRAAVHEAEAAVQEQQFTLDEARRQARLDLRNALQTLQAARRTVEGFGAGRLDRARELLDMAEAGYREGASSYLEVLDARQVYRQERTDHARALADYQISLAGLLRASGGAPLSANTGTTSPTSPDSSGSNSARNGSTTSSEPASRAGAQTSGGAVLPPPSSP